MTNIVKTIKNSHFLSLVLLFLSWGLGFFLFSFGSHNQPISNISLNKAIPINAIKINGKSFFPLGFYHTSFQLELQKKIEALQDMAAVGFNTIHASCNDFNEYNIFLDEAYRLGVYVITEFKGTEPLDVVAKFKDKPAVLGWSIADDVGDHENSDQIWELHKKVKAIDPKHFTYISISGWSKKWDDYAHVADIQEIPGL
jgi:beta-galactosidase/beta-glucuronidase